MFALSLPAVKSFKSGLPTSLHLRFFSLGVMGERGDTVWQMLVPCSFSVITFRQTAEYQELLVRWFELFTLVHGAGYSDGIFSSISIMENCCQKEGTVCAPNISRVHVGLSRVAGEGAMHKSTEQGSFPSLSLTPPLQEPTAERSLLVRHRTGTPDL